MRCSTCGLPLSSSRAVCPRCGTAYGAGAWNAQPELEVLPAEPGPSGALNNLTGHSRQYGTNIPEISPGSPEAEVSPAQWGAYAAASSAPWNVQGLPPLPPPDGNGGAAAAAVEQLPFPGMESGHGQSPYPGGTWPGAGTGPSGWQPQFSSATPGKMMTLISGATPAAPQPSLYASEAQWAAPMPQGSNPRTTRLGLTIASACIMLGALILIFVSIMAQNLTNKPPTAQSNSEQPTAIVQTQALPTSTATPGVTSTPTETFPGQAYIDNGRMASTVVETTGEVNQYATEFTTHQKVYVTFTVHAGATAGAVCLSWYVNNTYNNHYEFDVKANASYSAYSYALFNTAGPGSVEIAWASSMACADKQLAQHVTFTITG